LICRNDTDEFNSAFCSTQKLVSERKPHDFSSAWPIPPERAKQEVAPLLPGVVSAG